MSLKEEQIILIAKHFKGATSFEEESLIAKWLEENDQHKEAYAELELIYNSGSNAVAVNPDIDLAWNKVKLKAKIGVEVEEKNNNVRAFYSVNDFIKIAASLLLAVVAGVFIVYQVQKVELTEMVTANETREILLPDSSKVWLNKNSRLTYLSDFNIENRTVFMEGEVFFEVAKNPEKPFIVNGILSRTEVLGTSFNVRSLAEAGKDEVKVITGRVSFEANQIKESKVILLPGDQAMVTKSGAIEKSKIETYNSLAWKSKKLVFNNSSLEEVTEAAQSYFDIDIKINNPDLLICKFTGSFNEPKEEEMMKILSVTMSFSYEKSDQTYTLNGEGCK